MEFSALDQLLYEENEEERNAQQGIFSDHSGATLCGWCDGEPFYAYRELPSEQPISELIRQAFAEPFFLYKPPRYVPVNLHVHDWVELHYQYSGHSAERVGGRRMRLETGQTLLIDANAPHGTDACGKNDIILAVMVKKKFLNRLLSGGLSQSGSVSAFLFNALRRKQNRDSHILFETEGNELLRTYLCALACEYFDSSPALQDVERSLFTLVVCELARSLEEQSAGDDSQVIQILRYIEQNYLNCSLASVAEHFHLNPNYLSGVIRASTGTGYKEIVLGHKLRYAETLLKNTDDTVDAIAGELGYEDPSAFYRVFRETHHISPAAYRKQQRA